MEQIKLGKSLKKATKRVLKERKPEENSGMDVGSILARKFKNVNMSDSESDEDESDDDDW